MNNPGYGTGGVLASMTDPRGNATHYAYDASGYLTKIDSPAGTGETSRRVVAITPNPNGSPASDVDAKGQKTAYEYDGLGALTRISYGMQDGAADFSVSYTLDANGNMTHMSDKSGSSSWAYDANDQLTSESRTQNGQTKRTGYGYYVNGQMSTFTTFTGETVSYSYDSLGRLASQTDPNDGGRAITFSYDSLSRSTSVNFPSGVSQQFAYGPDDNLRQVLLRRADGTPLEQFDYAYGTDGTTGAPTADYWNGFVRGVTELDGSKVSYGYDDLGRLTSAVRTGANPYSEIYAYDANDNRTITTVDGVTGTATYDAADQVIDHRGAALRYDRNGNLLSDGASVYEYDASDETVAVTTGNGSTLRFEYDGDGRRVSRTVGTSRTDYWYDSTGLVLETSVTDVEYLRALGGELLSIRSVDGLHNYATDNLSNVTGLVSSNGTLSTAYGYRPWGQANGASGSVYNPYLYTSTYQDTVSGLYQMGARYYDPETSRFTQQDPLPTSIFEGQRYSYTPGNPVNYTDPTGLYPRRQGTEPTLPPQTVVYQDRITIFNFYRGGDHGPAHLHVFEEGRFLTKIGQNGKPLRNHPALTRRAARVVRANLGRIRWAVRQIAAYHRYNNRLPKGGKSRVRGGGMRGGLGGVCFSADTLVATQRGEKPISQIQVGDKVLAFDQATGTTGYYDVTEVRVRSTNLIEYLTIDGEIIETTMEHPFYTRDRGWIPAGELGVGARVRKADGSYGRVGAVELVEGYEPVYNLTVETAHTFFVGKGRWLVHNKYSIRFF